VCLFVVKTKFHRFLLKVFVRIFNANCVPLCCWISSSLVYLCWYAHIFVYPIRSSYVFDCSFRCIDCLSLMFLCFFFFLFVCFLFLIGLFFRVSVFVWMLFTVSHCLLYTSWLSTKAFLLFLKPFTFVLEDGRIGGNMPRVMLLSIVKCNKLLSLTVNTNYR
jgi:hypothetical protein